jgi:hypothetical protein
MTGHTVFLPDRIYRWEDAEPYIERNKQLKTQAQSRNSSFRHIASIPPVFYEKFLNEFSAMTGRLAKWTDPEFDAYVRKKLDDPDYRHLRVDK